MITAIAIDDEPLPLELLEAFCKQNTDIQLLRTFTSINEAVQFLENNEVDLMFLDIQMPKISGIQFYKNLNQELMVIFTTAFSQYAVEGFDLNAVDYLLKPFSIDRFDAAVKKALDYKFLKQSKNRADFLFIKADYFTHKIVFSEILLIESFADYLDIHLENQTKIRTRMSMKNMMEKLSPNLFIRVHRSYIVPFGRIEKVQKSSLFISGKEIPIGNNYKEEFLSKFRPK